jgi:hypothetical protein
MGLIVHGAAERTLVKISTRGPHMIRFEKKGEKLTISVCINYKGTFTADVSHTISGIRELAPFLNGKNTYFFFGRGGGRPSMIYKAIRLAE